MAKIGIRELLEAGAHFGHQTQRWNPKMRKFIFGGPRRGIHIIDLSKTVQLFEDAYDFITDIVANGKPVLFVGTKKQAQDIFQEEASRAGQYYVTNRWLGGTLTNWKTIKKSIAKLRHIEKMQSDGTVENMTKKEALKLEAERVKLERSLGGIKDMDRMPGAIFLVDPKKEHIAVREANILDIPVVAVVDTNCDPDAVDRVIPGNDDAIRSIRLFTSRIAEACLEGKGRAKDRRGDTAGAAVHAGGQEEEPTVSTPATEGEGPEVQRLVKRPKLDAAAGN
ncbi:MAG: 30S ribosomal protein S2 [Myxococcales bacterium]|nr:30S ribosomal protein S2 [Myxococcales bacterium]